METLRTPAALTVLAATTAVGAAAGSLGGRVAATIFAATGLLWGCLAVLTASWLSRSEDRRQRWANLSLFGAALAAALLTGAGLQAMLIMDASVSEAPQFFADLVRPPIGDAEALPYYLLNTPLEWLLVPAALLLNWPAQGRRILILAAAALFYPLRLWTYLYFVPKIIAWGEGSAAGPLSAAQLDQANLWVDLSWIRLAMDAAVAVLLIAAAFRVGSADAGESRRADPASVKAPT